MRRWARDDGGVAAVAANPSPCASEALSPHRASVFNEEVRNKAAARADTQLRSEGLEKGVEPRPSGSGRELTAATDRGTIGGLARAHRVGPKRPDEASRPRLIIACLLRHGQTRQLLQAARTHRPFRTERYDICLTADYSKDTNEHRKAFLPLRPRLCQLEIKHSLFDPARMWVTKKGVSKDFYDPRT
ncbi:hypothetical protein NDU88_008548 [Pleurodeles waltl]|uniref:Uncharacterized protein n=1 Tax=Pleurodeles waltl TaxID=8319 RepID=A0AAV7P184_PLEWA|nr:hypothetical protein NDU88_008548 [Pleurodeles waltl]